MKTRETLEQSLAWFATSWRRLSGDGRTEAKAVHGAYLRLLGLVSLLAFASYWIQLPGLIGSNGLVPTKFFLGEVANHLGPVERWFSLPTLAWLVGSSDIALHGICAAGVAFSLSLIAGLAPRLSCLSLWALYLSLCGVDTVFLSFQWDLLLLEMLFLGIFIAPDRRFLMRFLLFKLMFSSGLCKLVSGDPTWRSLTALDFHFETQPIPNVIAWYAHQLPSWFHQLSTLLMFSIEVGAPFLLFTRRRGLRLAGALAQISLQLLIFFTGNYCFFNLLALLLCLSLLEDADLEHLVPSAVFRRLALRARGSGRDWLRHAYPAIAALALSVGGIHVLLTAARTRVPEAAYELLSITEPFRTINGYGLFAIMTTRRDEITLEGSDDEKTWRPYEFRWKPGATDRMPPQVAPYQPRLDWQLWFAALSDPGASPWLRNLMIRLLQGRGEVLSLLGTNPFPEHPPKFVRARIARYHFTSFEEHRATGRWWRADEPVTFIPALSLGGTF